MIKNCKAVIFDFDGTLVDSGPGIVETIRLTLKEVGRPPMEDAALRACVGPPIHQFFPMVLGLEGEAMEHAIEIYRRIFDEVALPSLCPYPGILELLRDMKHAGFLTGIASCKAKPTCIHQADAMGISPFIDALSGAVVEEGLLEKGDILRVALDMLGVDSTEAVMVGDRMYDMIGAKEAGTRAIGVLYCGCGTREELLAHNPLALADTVEELRMLLLGE